MGTRKYSDFVRGLTSSAESEADSTRNQKWTTDMMRQQLQASVDAEQAQKKEAILELGQVTIPKTVNSITKYVTGKTADQWTGEAVNKATTFLKGGQTTNAETLAEPLQADTLNDVENTSQALARRGASELNSIASEATSNGPGLFQRVLSFFQPDKARTLNAVNGQLSSQDVEGFNTFRGLGDEGESEFADGNEIVNNRVQFTSVWNDELPSSMFTPAARNGLTPAVRSGFTPATRVRTASTFLGDIQGSSADLNNAANTIRTTGSNAVNESITGLSNNARQVSNLANDATSEATDVVGNAAKKTAVDIGEKAGEDLLEDSVGAEVPGLDIALFAYSAYDLIHSFLEGSSAPAPPPKPVPENDDSEYFNPDDNTE